MSLRGVRWRSSAKRLSRVLVFLQLKMVVLLERRPRREGLRQKLVRQRSLALLLNYWHSRRGRRSNRVKCRIRKTHLADGHGAEKL